MKFANANLPVTWKNAYEPGQILASGHEKVHAVIWLKKYSSTFFSIAQSKRVFRLPCAFTWWSNLSVMTYQFGSELTIPVVLLTARVFGNWNVFVDHKDPKDVTKFLHLIYHIQNF